MTMVQLTREAPSDPDWPDAAFVNVVGPAQDKQSFLRAVVTYAAGSATGLRLGKVTPSR